MRGLGRLDPIFEGTVQAAEEAIVNAMASAVAMTGVDGHVVLGMPRDRPRAVLRKTGRLAP